MMVMLQNAKEFSLIERCGLVPLLEIKLGQGLVIVLQHSGLSWPGIAEPVCARLPGPHNIEVCVARLLAACVAVVWYWQIAVCSK